MWVRLTGRVSDRKLQAKYKKVRSAELSWMAIELKTLNFLVALLCVSINLIAQTNNNFAGEIGFVKHLISRGHMPEAGFVLRNIDPVGKGQEDSVNFLKGWVHYSQKELAESNQFLVRVSENSPFYYKSSFFAAYNYAYMNQTGNSMRILKGFDDHDAGVIAAMQNFQLAGLSLLDRRLDDFGTHFRNFSGRYAVMAREEQKMAEYFQRLKNQPARSPVLAGLMSAAIPGLGRLYAGKPAEAIAGFMYVGAMMAVTYDFYNRRGWDDPLFLLSATVSALFYAGNIWGSVVTVNRTKNEFNHEIDQRILLDMHIPLRNLFP